MFISVTKSFLEFSSWRLVHFAAETPTVTVTATSTATVLCTETKLMVDANTAALVTLASNVPQSEMDLHFLGTTITVYQTPSNAMVDKGATSSGSLTVWMVVAILFLVIAIAAIVLSTLLGYILYKKTTTFKGSFTANSDHDTKESGRDRKSVETKYFNSRNFCC